jgi:hypothetical protein
MKFYTHFLHFSSVLELSWKIFSTGLVQTDLFCVYIFYTNWHSEVHGVHKCINEYTSVLYMLLFSLGEIGFWGHEHYVAEHLGVSGESVH